MKKIHKNYQTSRGDIGVKINQKGKPSLKSHQNSTAFFFFLIVAYYCLMSFSLFKFLFSFSFTKAILLIQENQKIRSVQKYTRKLQRALCPLTPPRSDVAYFSRPFSVDIHMDVFPFILSLSLSNSWFSFSAKIGLCSTFCFVNSYFIWPLPYIWTFRLFPTFCCYQPHDTVMKTSTLQPHVNT